MVERHDELALLAEKDLDAEVVVVVECTPMIPGPVLLYHPHPLVLHLHHFGVQLCFSSLQDLFLVHLHLSQTRLNYSDLHLWHRCVHW